MRRRTAAETLAWARLRYLASGGDILCHSSLCFHSASVLSLTAIFHSFLHPFPPFFTDNSDGITRQWRGMLSIAFSKVGNGLGQLQNLQLLHSRDSTLRLDYLIQSQIKSKETLISPVCVKWLHLVQSTVGSCSKSMAKSYPYTYECRGIGDRG